MIKRALVATGLLFAFAGTAFAQPQLGAPPRPAFSPYLNLARQGGSPALNYYGLVRPEVQARQSIQNLQGAVAANQQALGDVQNGVLEVSETGHQTMFLNQGSYFLNGGRGTTGGGGQGSLGRNTTALYGGSLRLPTPGSTGTGGGGRAAPAPRR